MGEHLTPKQLASLWSLEKVERGIAIKHLLFCEDCRKQAAHPTVVQLWNIILGEEPQSMALSK